MSGPMRLAVALIGAAVMLLLFKWFGWSLTTNLIVTTLGFLALFAALPSNAGGAKTPLTSKEAKDKAKQDQEMNKVYLGWAAMILAVGSVVWLFSSHGPIADYGRKTSGESPRVVHPLLVGHDNPDMADRLRDEKPFHPGHVYDIFELRKGQSWTFSMNNVGIQFRVKGESATDFQSIGPRSNGSRWRADQAGTLQLKVSAPVYLRIDRL